MTLADYRYMRRMGIGRFRAAVIAWRRSRWQLAAIRFQQARRLGR